MYIHIHICIYIYAHIRFGGGDPAPPVYEDASSHPPQPSPFFVLCTISAHRTPSSPLLVFVSDARQPCPTLFFNARTPVTC